MSSAADIAEHTNVLNAPPARASSWSLWTRQTLAILRLEIKKNFLGRRALLLYMIAGAPLVLLTMLALVPHVGKLLGLQALCNHQVRLVNKKGRVLRYLHQPLRFF